MSEENHNKYIRFDHAAGNYDAVPTTKPQSTTEEWEPITRSRQWLNDYEAGKLTASDLFTRCLLVDLLKIVDKLEERIAALSNKSAPASAAPVVGMNDAARLTDAEVDAWLEAHKNDPVDPAQANRVEWLFRKKLAASIVDKAAEWLRSFDERIAQGGKGAQDMERLYSEEAAFRREVIRAVETLALEPATAAATAAPQSECPVCLGKHHGYDDDGYAESCPNGVVLDAAAPVEQTQPSNETET